MPETLTQLQPDETQAVTPTPAQAVESFASMTPEQQLALELKLHRDLARKYGFSPGGYEHFHWLVFRHDMQPHELRWVEAYFSEWNRKSSEGQRGILNKAARGLFKSTDSTGFMLFVMGHFPHLSHLIIQARDDDAKKTGDFLADTIELNAGWKDVFPHVVPDKARGWSQNGYHIKDDSVPYDAWVQLCAQDHKRDPSFMAVSVQAGAIGMHPTGILLMDDIHDSKNTESMAEMGKVIKTLRADIIPTMNRPGRKPMMIVAYTPWKPDDAYTVLEQAGILRQLVTPAYTPTVETDPEAVKYDGQWVRLTCPIVYNPVTLAQQMLFLHKREFHRQLLCTLDVGKGEELLFYAYPLVGSESLLPMMGGADPTTVEKDQVNDSKDRSYFGIAFVAKLPQGGALVYGGVLRQMSHKEADDEILAAQTRFPNWSGCMVENVGPGAAYLQNARRNPDLRVFASDIMEIDEKGRKVIRSKDDRFLQMAKWFEDGTVKIAARDDEFLNALRYLFTHFWDLNKDKPHPAWDAGDATYAALKGIPDVLVVKPKNELPVHGHKASGLGSVWNSFSQ